MPAAEHWPTTAWPRSASASRTESTAAGTPRSSADGAVRTEKEAYPHAFVLLAAASSAIAGRPAAGALLEAAIAVVEEHFWSEDEGAMVESWDRAWSEPEAYRGANANMHMVEALLATGDATGDGVWYERARRISERLIGDVARAHDWRVVEHFDAGWSALPDYNADQPRHPFRPYGVTPGHGLEWARLLLQVGAGLPEAPDWMLEAARGLFARAVEDGWREPGGFVYTTDAEGGRWSATGCTGSSVRRSAPPPRCTRSPASATTSATTAPPGTSPTVI